MKRALAGAVLVTVLALAGCSRGTYIDNVNEDPQDYVTGMEVMMPSGRTIECVIFKYGNSGGITCDWRD